MVTSIGIGLSSPFLLISFVPAIGRRLPRPGPWMETFKQLMGFSLLAAAVWLFSTLQAQISRQASSDYLWFLLALSVAVWGIHHFGGVLYSTARRMTVRAVAIGSLVALGAGGLLHFEAPAAAAADASPHNAGCKPTDTVCKDHIAWLPFDAKRVSAESKAGRPVFMDFTAEWCANCKTNEKVFIETKKVRDALVASGVLPMKADLTNENDEIQTWLDKLGRSGIPAYVIYMPDGTHDLLPEAITSDLLVERLQKAASRFPPKQVAGNP
jgi:thiol:disulfide interchange protein DsbD